MSHLISRRTGNAIARLMLVVGVLAVVPLTESRAGGLLNFSFDPNAPTILATDGSLTYDPTSGDFNVQATGLFFLTNTVFAPITGSDLATLNMTVDQSGNLIGTGSLTVTGAIDIDGDGINDINESTLLTATISALGTATAGQSPWEFNGLMDLTGGALTQSSITLSGGGTFTNLFQVGQAGGFDLVVEQQVSGILGDFASSFSGATIKQIVTGGVIPEPSTATLGAVALITVAGWGMVRIRRRRIRPFYTPRGGK